MGRGALDSMFDLADGVVGGMERFYGKSAPESTATAPAGSAGTALAIRPGWHVTKTPEPDVFIVTNGSAWVTCSDRALADRVCMLLGGGK